MGIGPFAYVTFLLVFFKFNDASYDLRTSVHKTMGVVSYAFILVNGLTDSGMLLLDIALYVIASFFFYRAMTKNFEEPSHGTVVGIVVVGLLMATMAWRGAAGAARTARGRAATEAQTEAAIKSAVQKATQALQHAQPQSEMP